MKLGAQMYSVRQFCQTPEEMKTALEKVAAIGYRGVQLSGHNLAIPASDIAGWCKALDLEIICTHMGWQRYTDELDTLIQEHKIWDCKYPGIGGLPQEYRTAEGYARFAKEASAIAAKLAEHGMHFIYHNHDFEFIRYGRLTGMDILLRDSTPDLMFELDTHWVQAGGADPAQWIYKVEGRADVLHFKDMVFYPAAPERKRAICEIGEGNLNWEAIIQACLDTGVKYALVEQDYSSRDPFDSLAISYDYLASRGVY